MPLGRVEPEPVWEGVETRRKIYDQWMYERNNIPSLQDLRERDQRMEIRRALTDPPLSEITEGRALNTLLKKAISFPSLGTNAPNVPLAAEIVKNLNVAVDVGLGLGAVKGLRDGAPLDWPAMLQTLKVCGPTVPCCEWCWSISSRAANEGLEKKDATQ